LTVGIQTHRIASMSKLEGGLWTPEGFETSPYKTIANGTIVRMNRYFVKASEDEVGAIKYKEIKDQRIKDRVYLQTRTLPMVDAARRGLIANPQAARNLGRIDPETLEAFEYMIKDEGESFEATQQDLEAFTRMQLAFGRVPEMAIASGYPSNFPQAEIAAPFTVAEAFGRVHEVGRTIERMIDDRIDTDTPLVLQTGVLRTYWTFQVMGSTPLKMPDEPGDGLSPELMSSIEMLRAKFQDPRNR